jgi:hypothetical protein
VYSLALEKQRRGARSERFEMKRNSTGLRLKFDGVLLRIEFGENRRGLRHEFAGCEEQLLTYRAVLGIMLLGMFNN